MGQVYRAWDGALERAVAVKLVRSHDPREVIEARRMEGLAACALQRALWLRRRGQPAEDEARRGLAPAAKALEVDARDPVRWVLQARLQLLAGDAPSARRSLERAVAVNTLIRGNPAYRAATAELGSP